MPQLDAIAKVESFIVSIPRDVPYLGPLREGEHINEKGYLIRKGNKSIYPSTDMSVYSSRCSLYGVFGPGFAMS
jgi:galactonate dehydratase